MPDTNIVSFISNTPDLPCNDTSDIKGPPKTYFPGAGRRTEAVIVIAKAQWYREIIVAVRVDRQCI